ncbi:MoaD/ThiS family protein [Chloroflexota bacterium]
MNSVAIERERGQKMSIKAEIPSYLQPYTNNSEIVELNGSTVGKCLDHLIKQFPGIKKMLFTRDDRLHSYVGIYVNGKDAYPEDLAKKVKEGDKLNILYMISGG